VRRPRAGRRRHHRAGHRRPSGAQRPLRAHRRLLLAPEPSNYVPSVHLSSQKRRLAAAVDEALREAYARALGAGILNPEGDFPEQPDPTPTRDHFSLKHSHGGGGFRPTAERIPFLNSLFSALPAISGSTAQAPLWPSLAPIAGGWSVYDKDSKPEEQCWATFFASGCRMAREMQEETAQTRHLRDEALESAGLAANPPQSAVFDRPDEGIGYRIGKVQKRAFDETKGPPPRASSDAPITFSLQTSGAWPRCFRSTIVLQTRSARGRPCYRHHPRRTNSKPRRRRASESGSPASGPLPTYHSSLMPLRSTSSSTLSAATS